MSAKSPDVDFDASLAPEESWDVDVVVVGGFIDVVDCGGRAGVA